MLEAHKLGFAVVAEEIRIMKDTDPKMNVTATYNIAGLSMLSDVKTEKAIEVLKEMFDTKPVELTLIGEDIFTVKTTEVNHRKIQKKLGTFAPAAKWYSR